MTLWRTVIVTLMLMLLPGVAAAHRITCAELPEAKAFVDSKLRPGPNTRAARRHLARAEAAAAHAPRRCAAELRKVNVYARRSLAADARARHHHHHRHHVHRVAHHRHHAHHRHVACADWLHQDRPGGTDYHGPAVAGCRRLGA